MTRPTASPATWPYPHRTVAEMDDTMIAVHRSLVMSSQTEDDRMWAHRRLLKFLKEIGR